LLGLYCFLLPEGPVDPIELTHHIQASYETARRIANYFSLGLLSRGEIPTKEEATKK
jgi:hypothetical protein